MLAKKMGQTDGRTYTRPLLYVFRCGCGRRNSLLHRTCLTGKNLFHRAIVQSGSALSSWGVARSPRSYARQLAEMVNCTGITAADDQSSSSSELVDCFKGLSARTLVDAEVPGTPYRYLSALGPTVDWRTVLPSTVRVPGVHGLCSRGLEQRREVRAAVHGPCSDGLEQRREVRAAVHGPCSDGQGRPPSKYCATVHGSLFRRIRTSTEDRVAFRGLCSS